MPFKNNKKSCLRKSTARPIHVKFVNNLLEKRQKTEYGFQYIRLFHLIQSYLFLRSFLSRFENEGIPISSDFI
jgi:hypothetical protein